jgi:hypothetical protein
MFVNKDTQDAPQFALDMNALTMFGAPDWTTMPVGDDVKPGLKGAGFSGIQTLDLLPRNTDGFDLSGSGRVYCVEDAAKVAQAGIDSGYMCTTLHVGHGYETDA